MEEKAGLRGFTVQLNPILIHRDPVALLELLAQAEQVSDLRFVCAKAVSEPGQL